MWKLNSFIEIGKEEGLNTALKETYHHIGVVRHRVHKRVLIKTACDIRQNLSNSTKLPHPVGVVIGIGAEIGDDVKIYQNVTIGSDVESGEQPVIKDGVIISSGAVVIGDVTIGENSIVGANSVVLNNIPPDSIAVGAPATVVGKNE